MRGSRRSFRLWSRPDRIVASRGGIRGQNPQRFETWRSASRKSDEIRIRDQRENGEGTWRDGSIDDPGARRQGDRMIDRRDFMFALGAAAFSVPEAVFAQAKPAVARVGRLSPLSKA